ncbi:MAG: VapC toxin family PIN domain ribonuclease [Halochromatium sp.]|nr:VapC toxin family PIN domain ribonuclease [Halochromatium sp.]
MLYFDTSALLPYYRTESDSDVIQSLLAAQNTPVLISQLAQVEFASALARWVRMGELSEPQANLVEHAFHEDLVSERFLVQPVEMAHFERALHWLANRNTALRTLDVLQLACAERPNTILVTLDTVMRASANYLGLRTYRFTSE